MKSKLAGICTVIGSIMLIIALLIMSIEMFALNPGFFDSEYSKLGTAQSIGISDKDLKSVTQDLLEYTAGERENLDMQAGINGRQREVFNEREKDHMVDVRALYIAARTVRTVCFAGAAALLILAFLLSGRKALLKLCRSFLRVSGAFVVIVAALAVYAASDFNSFWTSFHHVFFTNELWILDPSTDVLIMMVPQQFFSDLVTRIIIRFISIFLTLNIVAAVGMLLYRKKQIAKTKEA